MISVDNVFVKLGGKEILHGISFDIPKGSICGYVGPNGAGKTTTLRLLTGTLAPEAGMILVDGTDVVQDALAVKYKIGYVPEAGILYESFTPMEYLDFIGRMYGVELSLVKRRATAWLHFWDLDDDINRRMVSFSKGMKQKVLISAALIHDPVVLLLDEPLNGLDAHAVLQFRLLLKNLALHGKTIFYSSHILDAVEKIVDKVIVLRAGVILRDGSPQDIITSTDSISLEMAFTNLTSTVDVQHKTARLIEDAFPEYPRRRAG